MVKITLNKNIYLLSKMAQSIRTLNKKCDISLDCAKVEHNIILHYPVFGAHPMVISVSNFLCAQLCAHKSIL